MYIEIEDIEIHIERELLSALTFEDTETNCTVAVNQAIGQLKSYLAAAYKITEELAKTGTARDALILMLGKDLVVYHLFSYIDPSHIPEARVERYKAAIAFLKDVQNGVATLSIDAVTDETKFEIKGGSNVKRVNQY